jgi:GNAT superfamily N-acetyltransferase
MSISYRELEPSAWQDLVKLFGTSRECGICWCMNHRLPPAEELTGPPAQAALKEQVAQRKATGILAYAGDQCVGWCAVDPLEKQPGHDYCHWKHAEKAPGTWSIHCLYVHPEFRGKGVSTGLVAAAVELARAAGATKLLAFPIPEGKRHHFPEHDGEFSGRLSSFKKAGFTDEARINDFYQVVALNF